MDKIDVRDMIAGLLLIAIGGFASIYAANQYEIGSPERMAPGFFPSVVGALLVLIGLIISALSLRKPIHNLKPPHLTIRAISAVTAAIIVFALLALSFGLIVATVATTFVAALAQPGFRFGRTAGLAAGLSLLCWIIFKTWLDLQLPTFAFLE